MGKIPTNGLYGLQFKSPFCYWTNSFLGMDGKGSQVADRLGDPYSEPEVRDSGGTRARCDDAVPENVSEYERAK